MKSAFIVAASIISASSFAQTAKPFTIKGSIKKFKEPVEKVFLSYRSEGKTITDSIEPKAGIYQFKGLLVEPVMAQIVAKPLSTATNSKPIAKKDVALVMLSAGDIQAASVDSFSNIVVKGSVANDEYLKIEALLKPINAKADKLNNDYMEFDKAKDEAGKNKIIAEYKLLTNESKEVYKNYYKSNPKSPLALYAVTKFGGMDLDPAEVDPLFNSLPESFKNLPSYKALSNRLVIARKTAVGQPAINFTQNDTLGNPVSLASFQGKYVLVDFWASWCGPCRRENPNVVTAFNKYKDKNFTVFGVSLDQPGAQARWIKAIHDDQLTWTHVSDLKFWDNEVAKLYGIQAIPFNLLLDKEGKIVAKNIRGEELQTKLAQLLN